MLNALIDGILNALRVCDRLRRFQGQRQIKTFQKLSETFFQKLM